MRRIETLTMIKSRFAFAINKSDGEKLIEIQFSIKLVDKLKTVPKKNI